MYPMDGLTVISAFPHAHLQGRSIWTKIIRNGTAVDYLFNGEEFNFNYQFSNRLVSPIKLYPVFFLSKGFAAGILGSLFNAYLLFSPNGQKLLIKMGL